MLLLIMILIPNNNGYNPKLTYSRTHKSLKKIIPNCLYKFKNGRYKRRGSHKIQKKIIPNCLHKFKNGRYKRPSLSVSERKRTSPNTTEPLEIGTFSSYKNMKSSDENADLNNNMLASPLLCLDLNIVAHCLRLHLSLHFLRLILSKLFQRFHILKP